MQPEPEDVPEASFAMREREVDMVDGTVRIATLVCEPLEEAGFVNAFSTRAGGVSAFPSNSLSLAYFKGDQQENVAENRRRFLNAIGSEGVHVVTARQTHSTERCVIESPEQANGPQPDCDALVTRLPDLLIGI